MKRTTFFLLFFSGVILTSFSMEKALLYKRWVYYVYDSMTQTTTYRSEPKFRETMCLQFLPEGVAWVEQNVSSCGTTFPGQKIKYEIVKGTWRFDSDSVLVLNHVQFGDEQAQSFKIMQITKSKLVVKNL